MPCTRPDAVPATDGSPAAVAGNGVAVRTAVSAAMDAIHVRRGLSRRFSKVFMAYGLPLSIKGVFV
ncbi:hypothetical protein [Nonomuraea rhizosphaerae]|uniref:hypothetical protein n=1 Tax=Nonomuraea rhizosphaerae TaxID=2665663 RepID=UPI0027E2D7FE|nr:hypothetical protein [Nonomuraea rhizosphaerae]